MRARLRQWLFRRRTQRFVSPSMSAYLLIERHRAGIEEDMEKHPEMCAPLMTKPTAHVTRIIDQGETLVAWNDEKRTWTMPTELSMKGNINGTRHT